MNDTRHRITCPHPTAPDREHHWLTLVVSEAGVSWTGEMRAGPTAGGYGMGAPQTHAEFLAAPKLPLAESVAAEVRVLCESFLANQTRVPVLTWTREEVLKALPDTKILQQRDGKGETALTRAVSGRWFEEVRHILDAGVDPDQHSKGVRLSVRPLSIACRSTENAAISLLLDAGADPQYAPTNRSYLCHAMSSYLGYHSRIDAVRLLLDAGVHPDHHPEGWNTSMMFAVGGERLDIAALLLERGADLNTVRRNGTALMRAAAFGKVDCVRWLLEHGARMDLTDKKGRTALDRAEAFGGDRREDCIALLSSGQ